MKYVLSVIIVVVMSIVGFLGYQKYQSINNLATQLQNELNQQTLQLQEKQDETLALEENFRNLTDTLHTTQESQKIYSIIAGGDIMMDRGVEATIKKLGKDYNFSFDLIRDYLASADLVFANLEGSLSNVGSDTGKPYSFRFEPAVAFALKQASIDLVSLANNHMLDWGRESLCQTTKNLEKQGISYLGAGCNSKQAEKPYIAKLGNTKVAFLAYTEFYQGAHATKTRPGMTEWNIPKIEKRIKELKEDSNIDLVIVSMHWGEEYKNRATDNQVDLGQQLIHAGADVVIGHHPHVDQEIERYADGWIIYSLGNFVFDQSWSAETMQGLLVEIKIQNKRVYDIIPKPIQLNQYYQPALVR